MGGMIFLFGSVRVTNPNCWCFILLVFSASKASGVLKNPIPVLPWSHYSCTFFNMSSFEQKSFHKNQHESSLSADFLLRRLDDFPKVSTIARFPPVFSTGKNRPPKWSNFSPPNSSNFKGQASLVVSAHRKVSIHRPIALQSASNQSGLIEPASRYPQVTNEKNDDFVVKNRW